MEPPKKTYIRTIKSLNLDMKSALAGETWKLLPDGHRRTTQAQQYPLPTRKDELFKLSMIPIPDIPAERDSGHIYAKRAAAEWKKRQWKTQSAVVDVGRRKHAIKELHNRYKRDLKELRAEANEAVNDVRLAAAREIANLNDLFALGREGIDKQMRAHLDDRELNGEKITARAFRECFRIVTQAVKGLGLPSEQRSKAADAVIEELAASLKSTQETVALAPAASINNDNEETEH